MTTNELKRKLAKLGAKFENANRHCMVTLNGRTSFIPRHDAKELRPGTLRAIQRQLGLKRI